MKWDERRAGGIVVADALTASGSPAMKVHRAALQYAKRGWLVVPLNTPHDGQCSCGSSKCASPGKHPRTAKGFKDASTDPLVIRRWWKQWPDANVGIVTGKPSRIVVLDVDGPKGLASMKKRGGVPPTLEVETGKGRHYYFRHPGHDAPCSAGKLPGVDVRGDGGYVVAPPSRHVSGAVYALVGDSANIELADLPDWIAKLSVSKSRKPSKVAGTIAEGTRNETLYRLGRSLHARGAAPATIRAALRAENRARCQPLLSKAEVDAIAAHAAMQPDSENFAASDEDAEVPDVAKVKPFPIEVFPSALQDFIEEGAASIGCPADFFGVPMLAVLGSAIGDSRVIEVKQGWCEGARVYGAVIGHPGSAKSPALHAVLSPVHKRQESLFDGYKDALDTYQQAQHAAKKGDGEKKAKSLPKPTLERIHTTDTTTEALAMLLADNPRGLLLARDELTAWVCGMDQYKAQKGTDRQFYLSAWSGENITIDRKGRLNEGPIVVPNPFLCVVGCLPPDMLDTLADDRGRDDGFLHRILFAYPDKQPPGGWTDAAISPGARAAWDDALAVLWKLKPKVSLAGAFPIVVHVTPKGRQAWIARYNAHAAELGDKNFPYGLQGPWMKLTTYAARFALILQLSRVACRVTENERIESKAIEGAWQLVDYFKSHARRVYQQLAVSPQEKADNGALTWIRKQGGKTNARTLLKHHVANVKNADEAKALLHRLASRGFGTVEEEGAQVRFQLLKG